MTKTGSNNHAQSGGDPWGLLTPEECRQRAEDCEQRGMTELAAKWRRLAEQTERIGPGSQGNRRLDWTR
jgi:hypothetical protein